MMRIGSALIAVLLAAALSAPAEESAGARWSASANAGLNLTRGNSRTTAGNVGIVAERKGDAHEATVGVEGNYGQSEQTDADGGTEMKTTVQNEKGYAGYRYLFTDRDYAYMNGELSQDKIADIKYRLILGPGLGRYWIKSDKNTFGTELGISWIKDKIGEDEGDRFALRFAEKYELKISDTAKVWESVEYLPAMDDFDNYLINGEIGVEAAMNSRLSLRIVAQDKYNNVPADDKEKNDFTVTAGIGYKL